MARSVLDHLERVDPQEPLVDRVLELAARASVESALAIQSFDNPKRLRSRIMQICSSRMDLHGIELHPRVADLLAVDDRILVAATSDGLLRSADRGEHWEKVDLADHGLPVWSLAFDPRDPKVLYAGYENCEIFRSEDEGERWHQLPVTVRFPEITVAPVATTEQLAALQHELEHRLLVLAQRHPREY